MRKIDSNVLSRHRAALTSVFVVLQPDTSLKCETIDIGLVHRQLAFDGNRSAGYKNRQPVVFDGKMTISVTSPTALWDGSNFHSYIHFPKFQVSRSAPAIHKTYVADVADNVTHPHGHVRP